MDYIFASAIQSTELALIAISYDIVCQWFINMFTRILHWPEPLRPKEGLKLRPLIPKFHEPAHLEKGHEQYSFNLVEGIGLSDSECSERVWGSHNPLAGSTRTMGPGTREDVLDDNFGHWNWLKYIAMGTFYRLYIGLNLNDCRHRENTFTALQRCRCRLQSAARSPLWDHSITPSTIGWFVGCNVC